MAVHAHSPRGTSAPWGAKAHGAANAPRTAMAPGTAKAHGLAVWVAPPEGQDIDPEVLARAAELVLARALQFAPEAEVHWPAAGAATSAAGTHPGTPPGEGEPNGAPDGGTPVPPSSSLEDSPYPDPSQQVPAQQEPAELEFPETDDGGAPHLPPSAGHVSRVAVDLAQSEVLLDGERVPLTGVEFKLLRYLVEHCSRTVDREELRLFLESFDSPGAATRSIDVYVGRVRRKLRDGRHAIATVRGGGYRFISGPAATVRGPAEYSI
ncbi:two-component system OmpR family response regulator [Arthrobacter globiformis]|uniref:winged helix-turn-helix domain-containing protein n=1 Tax=Arthrobacter globiformis TaxID=1665 RepID=UPI0027875F2E|nr:winged helix-turn-helix domain-containing protein [Arthrobacter globiformis]MDQ1060507.1 two-component system OmpR family response regulator [Arthrobacter globiformis]